MSKKSDAKAGNVISKVVNVIINCIFVLAVLFLIISVKTAYDFKSNPEDAYVFGYKPVYILTGSMEPTLREKGVCVVKKATYDEVDVGDIIMYTIEDKTITHRIVEKTEEGIRTKGDNNDVNDAYLLQEENIRAKVICAFNFTATIINDLEGGIMGYVKWIFYPVFVLVVVWGTIKLVKKIVLSGKPKAVESKEKEENKAV